jgi:hypothetical protein
LIRFIALLAVRNPRLRETMRQAQQRTAKMIMDLALASRERWEAQMEQMRAAGYPDAGLRVSYEEMKAFHESNNFCVEIDRTRQIARELSVSEQVLPLLLLRHWSLLKAGAGSGGFITSDHPVCLMWANPAQRGGFYGPGLGLPETELLFPVSKELGLLGRFEGDEREYDVNAYAVAAFNGAVACFAERQVIAEHNGFRYVMRSGLQPRGASDLLSEPGFTHRPRDHGESG